MKEKKVQVFAVTLLICACLLSVYMICTIVSYAITSGQWHEITWRKAALSGVLAGCLIWLGQSCSRMLQQKFGNPVSQVRSVLKIKSRICIILFLLNYMLTPISAVEAKSNPGDASIFDRLFANWTQAFNRKDLVATSSLFSKDCVSSNPGAPHKDYAAICGVFKSLFNQSEKTYHYRYKLQDVYRSGNLATVRITWYLDITKDGKVLSKSEEQGIDIFQRNDKGVWQIVNFIAYSENLKL